jgi:hypothetical protein
MLLKYGFVVAAILASGLIADNAREASARSRHVAGHTESSESITSEIEAATTMNMILTNCLSVRPADETRCGVRIVLATPGDDCTPGAEKPGVRGDP